MRGRPPLPAASAVASLRPALSVSGCPVDPLDDCCLEGPTGTRQPSDDPADGLGRSLMGETGGPRSALPDLSLLPLPVNSVAADTPHVLCAGVGSIARLEGTVPSLSLLRFDHSRPPVFPPRTLRSVRHHHQGGGYPQPGLGGWARMSAAWLASRQLRGGSGGGIGPRGDRHQSPNGRGECAVDAEVLSRDQPCSGRQRASSRETRY